MSITKNKKKCFEILKFVDFHFKFVHFGCHDSTVKCSFSVNLQVRQTNMDHCCTLSAMFFAKLHTRSQNLNYNSLYSTGTWHAINDTYKKVALNSKEKRCEILCHSS